MPIQRTLNHDFFKTWSPDMAYVLGYFAADGSMLKSNRETYYIEFTSTDRIQIGSREWFEDLTKLGFTQNKSLTLKFPDVPAEYLGHFVRGYFDGDGCAYFKSHFAKDRNKERWFFLTLFTSGSLGFLESLWARLKESGLKGGHISPKSKSGYELVFSWHDSLALYCLMYHTTEASDLFLPRKREKIEEAIRVLELDK